MFARRSHRWISVALLAMGCGGSEPEGAVDLVGAKPAPKAEKTSPTATPSAGAEQGAAPLVIDLIQDHLFRARRDEWTLVSHEADFQLAKLRRGGFDAVVTAIPAPPPGRDGWEYLVGAFDELDALAKTAGGAVELAGGLDAARQVRARGRFPLLVLVEGAGAVEGHVAQLPRLRERGLAVLGLVGARANGLADSASDPRSPGGLTEVGKELLARCRENGIVVDLTHASQEAFWQAFTEQLGLVTVSHSACRALMDHPRNLTDLQILALARAGGVMGLVFNPDFLKLGGNEGGATLEDVVGHVMRVKAIGAVNGLALGTDFGGIRPPRGLEDAARLPVFVEALRGQGLPDAEIDGILGGNAARLFDEVERERGVARVNADAILRPLSADCGTVIGAAKGSPSRACDSALVEQAVTLGPSDRLRVRLSGTAGHPMRVELFGRPGTPWQVEGQDLEGDVLFNRMLRLGAEGRGAISVSSSPSLVRLFLSPTRQADLREVVVWGSR